jgi:hypothetical protein
MVTLREIAEAEEKREELEEAYLRERGWQQTCETPGSLWVWTKTLPDGRVVLELAEPRHSPLHQPWSRCNGGRATGKGPANARTRRRAAGLARRRSRPHQ